MKEVQMYYANLTNIDLAMFVPGGKLRGDSFNLHVKMSGTEDLEEAVLIDFSTAKKRIKSWIDDHKGQGFDHKCWVTVHPEMGIEVNRLPNDVVEISTPHTTVIAPSNCFRILEVEEQQTLNMCSLIDAWENSIGDYLVEKFAQDGQAIEIEVKLTNNMSYPAFCVPELNGFVFRYTHGLKNSTSFGCQNIAHGHISYIAFEESPSIWETSSFWPGSRELYSDEIRKIVNELDGVVFAWSENVTEVADGWVTIKYTSSRGAMLQKVKEQDCIILDCETTVEHLAEFVAGRYRDILESLGIAKVYVSEGLEKGGIADVGNR